ncbi:hypothetical protein JST97_13910 [bacterium]|nr:hypothetical protein [bacterium]
MLFRILFFWLISWEGQTGVELPGSGSEFISCGRCWFRAARLAYGALYRRKGLSEAVVAHGVTNLCICVQVLAFDQWSLWS